MTAGLMAGKRGLIMGVANDRSIAWAIAKAAAEQGAQVGLSYYGERLLRRVKPLAEEIDAGLKAAVKTLDELKLELLYGDTYDASAAGTTLGFAINSGRIAGENALKYIGKS